MNRSTLYQGFVELDEERADRNWPPVDARGRRRSKDGRRMPEVLSKAFRCVQCPERSALT
jgi:hypothetical protein